MLTRHTHVPNCTKDEQAGKLKLCAAPAELTQDELELFCCEEALAGASAL
jgi:hypothetical protein